MVLLLHDYFYPNKAVTSLLFLGPEGTGQKTALGLKDPPVPSIPAQLHFSLN